MSSSLCIVAKSPELRDKMVRFMDKSYRSWGDRSSCPEKMRSKNKICIEYSCLFGTERLYVYSIARWMALQVGEKRKKFSSEDVVPSVMESEVPFIVVDDSAWPVLSFSSKKEARKLPKSILWCASDRLGCYLGSELSSSVSHAVYEEMCLASKDLGADLGARFSKMSGSRSESRSHEEWMEKRDLARAELTKDEAKKILGKIRKELRRLSRLWEKEEKADDVQAWAGRPGLLQLSRSSGRPRQNPHSRA